MARPVSSLESHPQRDRIVSAMAAGRPLTEISAWTDPPVHRAALNRFKSRAIAEHDDRIATAKAAIALGDKELSGVEQQAVHKAVLTLALDPFVSRALKSDTRRERWMGAAEASKDYRALSALDRNDLTSQEYQARLAGRLDTRPTGPDSVSLHLHLGIPRLDPARGPQQLAAQDVSFEALPPADVGNKTGESE